MSFAAGGRIPTRRVNGYAGRLQGGRRAVRLNPLSVFLICKECQMNVLIRRADQQPMSEADVIEALTTWRHECRENQ